MWLERATLNRRVRRCSRRVLSRDNSIFPCIHPIRTAYEYRLNLTQVSKLSYNIYTDFFFLQLIKRSVFTGIVTTKVSVFKVHPRWKLLRFEVVSGEYLLYQSLFGGSEKHAWYCERCLWPSGLFTKIYHFIIYGSS